VTAFVPFYLRVLHRESDLKPLLYNKLILGANMLIKSGNVKLILTFRSNMGQIYSKIKVSYFEKCLFVWFATLNTGLLVQIPRE